MSRSCVLGDYYSWSRVRSRMYIRPDKRLCILLSMRDTEIVDIRVLDIIMLELNILHNTSVLFNHSNATI